MYSPNGCSAIRSASYQNECARFDSAPPGCGGSRGSFQSLDGHQRLHVQQSDAGQPGNFFETGERRNPRAGTAGHHPRFALRLGGAIRAGRPADGLSAGISAAATASSGGSATTGRTTSLHSSPANRRGSWRSGRSRPSTGAGCSVQTRLTSTVRPRQATGRQPTGQKRRSLTPMIMPNTRKRKTGE